MNFFSMRTFRQQPLRAVLTVGGVSLCILLMLFLLSIYRGVADGSVEYIRENKADLWVLQRNAWNILRGSSLLSTGHGMAIREVPGVQSVSPVLFILSGIKNGGHHATVFLTGFDVNSGLGGPPEIVEGRSVLADDEIVLDKAFAAKMGYRPGHYVQIQDDTLRVVGLSTGTNAFVIQYAFVTLRRAQSLVGYPSIVTCFLVKVNDSVSIYEVAERIREELPIVEVYDHDTFLQNNIREMESGFLPLLYTVAVLGAVVLTVILSLLLSINILECRKDFAVMKILGSPNGFLPLVVTKQALAITTIGNVVALILFFPVVAAIEKISPEVSARSSLEQIVVVGVIVWAISLLSALISIQRLRRIYPLEVFA